jgi:hypothetical protein
MMPRMVTGTFAIYLLKCGINSVIVTIQRRGKKDIRFKKKRNNSAE